MKLKITIQNGSLAGKTAELDGAGFLTVGRDLNCDVRFDPNERIISTKHAYIEGKADGFYLTDNNSTNGTFVNGERIQFQKLKTGDAITFGKDGITAQVFVEMPQPEPNRPPRSEFQSPSASASTFSSSIATQILSSSSAGNSSSWRDSMTRIGLRPPDIRPMPVAASADQTGKKIAAGLTIFAVVFLSLIVVLMITSSLGLPAAIIAAIVAFVPACVYILPLVWLDRYDPEPLWLLGLAFAWGALVAVIFSATINDLMGAFFGETVQSVVSAPVFEEASKGVGLILLLVFFRREFDDILDGIVYGGTIALGFATVENVLYYGRALLEGGFGMLFVLFFVRGILSPFAHVTFTAMTGIGCGIARETHNPILRVVMPIIGYGFAVLLHAIWNGTPTFFGGKGFWLGYAFLQIPFFLIFVCFAGYVMYRQNKILKEMLAVDVARGLLSEQQYQTATSALKSSAWLLGSIGTNKFKARQRFLRAVGKLGLSYWHIQRATDAQGQTASFQQNPILREEVLRWRDKV
jgi:protease PrsW